VVPYFALSAAMYFALDTSYWLVLLLAVPAAGFLMRTYILFHDCTHGSFLPGKRANQWAGILIGLIVYSPFYSWRHNHAVHHATSGDLNRRGVGDVPLHTVAEYRAMSRGKKIEYRLYRNPLVMFGLGPIWSLMIGPRFTSKKMRPRIRRSVIGTNIALVFYVGFFCWLMGWQEFLLVMAPTAWLGGMAGVFMFYVQHQFEDAYWENGEAWSYDDAGLRGSSYIKLPQPFQFFTGNIGLHHVHHLSARIPNYNLQDAHDANPVFQSVPTLTFWGGIKAVRLKLWDEERGRLVTWREAASGTP
jgi:omega-6 fatty acid desaturase (delta-12 desaturase)